MVEEVRRIISASANIKHRALLTTIYGSGLRASEAVRLRPEYIESGRMMVRVEQGKGCKDRATALICCGSTGAPRVPESGSLSAKTGTSPCPWARP